MNIIPMNSEVTMSSLDFLVTMINPARAEHGEPEIENRHFIARIEDEIDDLGVAERFYATTSQGAKRAVNGYTLTMDQMMLVGMRESKAVRRSVLTKLKATRGSASNKIATASPASVAEFAEIAGRMLNMSNSSKLGMLHKIQVEYALPNILPVYAIDAPSDVVDGSSRPTKSLTEILKGTGISAKAANPILAQAGIVEQKERPASKGGVKKFWSLTAKGMLYGKNMTSPSNPRETQPHFFESASSVIIEIIKATSKGGEA